MPKFFIGFALAEHIYTKEKEERLLACIRSFPIGVTGPTFAIIESELVTKDIYYQVRQFLDTRHGDHLFVGEIIGHVEGLPVTQVIMSFPDP